MQARIPTAVRAVAARVPGPDLTDLARYADFPARSGNRADLVRLVARLQADPAIAAAWLEPHTEPARLDFGTIGPGGFVAGTDSASGSFEARQGYLGDAPTGIGALAVRDRPGALGGGVRVIDVEGGWLWSHEDLPAPFVQIGDQIDSAGWRYHGTAVIGVIRGQDNGLGVTGIAPECLVGHSSIGSQSTSEAITAAAALLGPGDVIVIELHGAGPNATGNGQEGYVPMEFWQDNFAAIAAAARRGIIVVEAAGNGWEDLDAPIYQGLFDPDLRHSGAIMVGATDGAALDPAWFTNHGRRVDLNGWGFDVTTVSYGDLQGSPAFPEEQWYTATFNGTSSATPIVTGAVVSLTAMVREATGIALDAHLARDLLLATGTPALGPRLIGARPDLVAARDAAVGGVGLVTGVVTESGSGLPVADVLVSLVGGTAAVLTAADGSWQLPLASGPAELEFSRFAYLPVTAAVDVPPGAAVVVDRSLVPVPRVDITGTVYGGGQPLAGARLDPLHLPIAPVTSAIDGSFVLPRVPTGEEDQLLVAGVPGFGARVVDVSTVGATADVVLRPVLSPVDEDFGQDGGGFSAAAGLWTHGAPPPAVPGAFTGVNCWGVGLDGLGYADGAADTLTSPLYDLGGLPPGPYYLSFHYFAYTEANFDGVNLEVGDGTSYVLRQPLSGYSDLFLGGLDHEAGWSGHTLHWTGAVFDIGDFVGGPFRFRLKFGADGGVTAPGFFIDGITFGRGLFATPVPDGPPAAPAAALQAWPNPFNPVVNIAWTATRPGPLSVAVYDLRGRLVRRLLDGPVTGSHGALRWDGRDERGHGVASGVYLVLLQEPGAARAAVRVVLAK